MTVSESAITPSEKTASARFFTTDRIARGMMLFLWIGLAARAVRYFLKFPLWEDECFLCVNFIDRSFTELLQPLTYHQVAPPLFLWLERASVLLLGYSEWSLRLIPFLASLASLFLFRRLAGQLLDGPGRLLAFGIFAVAYPGIRYAAEAKPYATDLFAALVLLVLAVEWYRSRRAAPLIALALLTAPLLWLSYPAAFVAGGVSLAIGAVLVRGRAGEGERRNNKWTGILARERRDFAESRLSTKTRRFESPSPHPPLSPPPAPFWSWVALNLAIAIGFGSLLLVIRKQSGAELGFMTSYWSDAFPPLTEPLRLVLWFVRVHTSELLAWPVGGARGASLFTAILAAIGLWQLFKKRDLFWGVLLLGPLALNLVAAAMHRYPYGEHIKFSMYAGPTICLLAGWGAAAWNAHTARKRPRLASRAAMITLGLLVLVATGSMARDVLHPYKTRSDERARAFAQWFWFNAQAEGDVRVIDRHAGTLFSPEAQSELTWTAMFRCNRAIYAPETEPVMPRDKARLRCLVYRDPRFEFHEDARDRWLSTMREEHILMSRQTFPFTRYGKDEESFVTVDYLDLYTFRPRSSQQMAKQSVKKARR